MENIDSDLQVSLRSDWMIWSSHKPSQIFTEDDNNAKFDRGRVMVSSVAP